MHFEEDIKTKPEAEQNHKVYAEKINIKCKR